MAFRLAHPFALTTFCVTALPWYVVCARRNPGFLHVFILQHNFERYLTPMFQHRQPFWYFGPILLLALLPWTVMLWPLVQDGLRLGREKSWTDSPGFFFACWAIVPVLFFSFSQSKLPGYILPSIPPLALLCAVRLARTIRGDSAHGSASIAVIGTAMGFTWIALGSSSELWMRRVPQAFHDAAAQTVFMSAMILRQLAGSWLSFWVCCADPLSSSSRFFSRLCSWRSPPRAFCRRSIRTFQRARTPNFSAAICIPTGFSRLSCRDRGTMGWRFTWAGSCRSGRPQTRTRRSYLTSPQGLEEMKKLGRFNGTLEEEYRGLLFVPAFPLPR